MSKTVNKAVELINNGKASCVIIRDGKIIYSELSRGIKPMISAYENGLLSGSTVVDKVVGKAAAMVMALGKVKSCYALTASKGAISVFEEHGICVQCGNRVEYIVNRTGNGMCPMEESVQGVSDLNQALKCIKERLDEISK